MLALSGPDVDRRPHSSGHSPYRKPALSERVAAAPRARRISTRNLKPSTLIFALLGSAVAHAAALAPSAAVEPSTLPAADPAQDPELPSGAGADFFAADHAPRWAKARAPTSWSGSGAFFFTIARECRAGCLSGWGPPPPLMAACYERERLCDAGIQVSPSDAYGYLLTRERTWISVATGGGGAAPVRKVSTARYRAAIDECLEAVQHLSSGTGRVFARLDRRQDGTAISRVEALEGEVDPGLVCCVREAQGALASSLRPGAAVAFMLRVEEGYTVEVTPVRY
jgi:hypothetical protein